MNLSSLRIVTLFGALLFAAQVRAQLTIDIVGVGAQQIPVAVAGFAGSDAALD